MKFHLTNCEATHSHGFPSKILLHLHSSYLRNTPYKPETAPKIFAMVLLPSPLSFGWAAGKNKTVLTFIDNRDRSLQNGWSSKKIQLSLYSVGHLVLTFSYFLPNLYSQPRTYFFFQYLPVCTIRCTPPLTKISHYWDIGIHRFTPVHQNSLLIPQNHYVLNGIQVCLFPRG